MMMTQSKPVASVGMKLKTWPILDAGIYLQFYGIFTVLWYYY